MGQYVAKSCGSRTDHDEHIHVMGGRAWACFGYHAPKPDCTCPSFRAQDPNCPLHNAAREG